VAHADPLDDETRRISQARTARLEFMMIDIAEPRTSVAKTSLIIGPKSDQVPVPTPATNRKTSTKVGEPSAP
jgi:hypothetical protein